MQSHAVHFAGTTHSGSFIRISNSKGYYSPELILVYIALFMIECITIFKFLSSSHQRIRWYYIEYGACGNFHKLHKPHEKLAIIDTIR